MVPMHFRCVKTNKTFPFNLNLYTNPQATSEEYSSLVLEWWYDVDGFLCKVPFQDRFITIDATKTPLKTSQDLSELMNIQNIFYKDECFNPYWTHKDRRSEFIVNVAKEQWVDKIVCLTAGNAWYSLSRYCAKAEIDYTSLVFPRISEDRAKALSHWWHLMYIDWLRYKWILRPRDFVQIVAEHDKYERQKKRKNIRAVTNSFEPISINAYKQLMYEIADQNPDYIVLPCGSGDLIVWVWLAIEELGLDTRIIAVWPQNEHPLGFALQIGNDEYVIKNYKEQSVAEKLTSPFTAVLPILYKIFFQTKHIYIEVDNETILKTHQALDDINIKTELSAATAFAWLVGHSRPDIPMDAKVIVVSTGKWLEL